VGGVAAGASHSMALKLVGTGLTWGRNQYGQLGDGTLVDKSGPVQVPGFISITDSDQDGIPDASEGGLSPFVIGVDDRNIDSDGDGHSNSIEFLTGTHPLDKSSSFKVSTFESNPTDDTCKIEWPSINGKIYQVQCSSDLATWTDLGTVKIGTGEMLSITDTSIIFGTTRKFYRIKIIP
jgi:hypothetical protein